VRMAISPTSKFTAWLREKPPMNNLAMQALQVLQEPF
jgi:hypothetical protein